MQCGPNDRVPSERVRSERVRSERAPRGSGVLGAVSAGVLAVLLGATAAAGELPGRTYDYHWDGKDRGHPERAWWGRAYLPNKAVGAEEPLPLVVFLHGLNKTLIKHRWMGGGTEGDVRAIVGAMVDDGRLPPLIVAAPSSIIESQVAKGASWNHFDLEHFLERTDERLDGLAKIDPSRVVVAGHSGAGCSEHGGLATAHRSRRPVWALLAIDTCMAGAFAKTLTEKTAPNTHVIVGYQRLAWERPFAEFERLFQKGAQRHPPADGVLRALDLQQPDAAPHDATVGLTFERWLPKLLPHAASSD